MSMQGPVGYLDPTVPPRGATGHRQVPAHPEKPTPSRRLYVSRAPARDKPCREKLSRPRARPHRDGRERRPMGKSRGGVV